MVSRTAIFLVLALGGAGLVSPAIAQEADRERQDSLPSLRERLEQFRQDLIGDPLPTKSKSNNATTSKGRPSGPQRRSNATAAKSNPQAKTAPGTKSTASPSAELTPTPGDVNSAVATPPRLEVQSARKAQPSLKLDGTSDAGTQRPPQKKSTAVAQPSTKKVPAMANRVQPKAEKPEESADDASDTPRVAKLAPRVTPKELPAAESSEPSKLSEPPVDQKSAVAQESGGVLFTSKSPALSIEVAGPRRVMIGKEAQFAVKLFNSGAAANDVVVSVNIPNYAEVVSAQGSTGAAQAPISGQKPEPLQWRISRLEANSTETLSLKLVPRKSAPLDLAVQWTYTPEASQALVEVEEPKLVIAISGPNEVLYGQSKIYKLTVSNPGNGDTENVMVGLLPLGGAGESLASHRLGILRAGESKTIDVELTARQAGAVTIKAQAFADGGLRCEAAEQVLVRRANLLIEVEAPKVKYAGTVGTYHVKVINAGNATADNVQVAAMLPPDAKYVASSSGGRLEPQQGKIKWTIGPMQAGAERRFEMQCSLSAPGDNRLQFMATADDDLSSVAMSSTRVEAIADLKLEVRDPQGPIGVSEDAVYEVAIRNRGTKAAEGVELTVFFSEGLEAVSVEGGAHEIGPGQVAFQPIGILPAGEAASYRVHARADRGGNHAFRVEVTCPSLHTKLTTEETTHFYGDDPKPAAERQAPQETSVSSSEPAPEPPRDRYSNP